MLRMNQIKNIKKSWTKTVHTEAPIVLVSRPSLQQDWLMAHQATQTLM